MKKIRLTLIWVLMLMVLLISGKNLTAQNIIITDNETQNADVSAMLDVYSNTKGMLVPRLTQAEMENISSPAPGLLVYNTTNGNFFFYTGTEWLAVGVTEYFLENAGNLHTREDTVHIGIGTSTPLSKLTVQGDQPTGNNEALFEVKNSEGQAIFAVYENEVRVNFKEDGTKSTKGGFAVGGLRPNKAGATDYFRISPDTVQVFINDNYGTKGRKGGFAVGGLSPNGKGDRMTYLSIGPDSTRVYVNDTSFSKGRKGGFAVGGLSPNKSVSDLYLTIERDSARIFMDNSGAKGRKGGFAVGGLSPNKSGASSFLDLTPDNYFIGHNAGANTTPDGSWYGMYNSFIGYESGLSNTTGHKNVFLGYHTGFSNKGGFNNVFIGNEAGNDNVGGYRNVFIGTGAGLKNYSGYLNTFIGNVAGHNNYDGVANTAIGNYAGYSNESGQHNVFVGQSAGNQNISGNQNVYIGRRTGYWNKTGVTNTYIGDEAGRNDTISNYNVFIGATAGYNIENGSSNVFIGYQAGYYELGSNKLYIANSGTGAPLIYGEFDNKIIKFDASIGIAKTPLYKLDVDGNVNVSAGSDYLINGTSISTQWTNSGSNIYYTGGNVGIGSANPTSELVVLGANTTTDGTDGVFVDVYNGVSTNSVMSGIRFNNNSNTTTYLETYKGAIFYRDNGYYGIGDLCFAIDNTGDYSAADYNDTKMIIKSTGDVGIGTISPTSRLHVEESVNSNGGYTYNYAANIYNTSTGTSPDVLALRVGTSLNPSTGVNFIGFFDGSQNLLGEIQGDGAGGIQYVSKGRGYAEYLPKQKPADVFEAGDVVGIINGMVTKSTDHATQISVIAGNAMLVGGSQGEEEDEKFAKVIIMGQAGVKVQGNVKTGDLLLPSGKNDGFAIAVEPEKLLQHEDKRIIGVAGEIHQERTGNKIAIVGSLNTNTHVTKTLMHENQKLKTRVDAQQEQISKLREENRQIKQMINNINQKLSN